MKTTYRNFIESLPSGVIYRQQHNVAYVEVHSRNAQITFIDLGFSDLIPVQFKTEGLQINAGDCIHGYWKFNSDDAKNLNRIVMLILRP